MNENEIISEIETFYESCYRYIDDEDKQRFQSLCKDVISKSPLNVVELMSAVGSACYEAGYSKGWNYAQDDNY